MRGFGIIEEQAAAIKKEMTDFFVEHGVEETFELRVNSDEVAQKVKATLEAMHSEVQNIIDEAPEECREEAAAELTGLDDFPAEMLYSHFKDLLKSDVYKTLKVLVTTAEELDPEGGYDKIINMSMEDVVKTLTRDEKIDDLLDKMKSMAIHTLLVTAAQRTMLKHMPPELRFLLGDGPAPSDMEDPEAPEHDGDSEDGPGGLESLLAALGGILGVPGDDDDIDDDEGEDPEDDDDLSGFGGSFSKSETTRR